PFDLDLYVRGDEIACGQDVRAAPAGARDEVARRRGAHLERQSARRSNGRFHLGRYAVEMAEAARELRRRVDDRDLRLLHVLVGEPECAPLRPAPRPHRRAGLEIAAELAL